MVTKLFGSTYVCPKEVGVTKMQNEWKMENNNFKKFMIETPNMQSTPSESGRLNELFEKQFNANKFYKEVKHSFTNKFKNTVEAAGEVPIPSFVKI